MRIGIVQFYHESNSFSPNVTGEEQFRADCYLRGEAIFDRWKETDSVIAGFLDVANEDREIELVPILAAWAWPAGPVADGFLNRVQRAILFALDQEPLHGLALSLHGACLTETRLDAEGSLLDAIRMQVGPSLPIVSTFDFHANVSPRMVETLDAFVGYKTYPHVDYRERGADALRLLARIVRGEVDPTTGFAHPPLLLVPQRQWTSAPPMGPIMQRAREIEEDPRVLVANVFGGFAYGDTPHTGFSAAVTTNGEPELAQRYADELAHMAWDVREDFVPKLSSVVEAVEQACTAEDGLTVLVDIGDNIGGGTPGDGTYLLRELVRQRAEGAVVILADPKSAADAASAGIGANVRLRVGGKRDEWHGPPVAVNGRVRTLFDGTFVNVGPMRDGIVEHQGLTARIATGGIDLVLTSRKMPPWNLEQLRSIGIEPTRMRIFVAKSAIAFRAAYEPIAARVIEVNTRGLTSADLENFPFRRLRRPIFPLDRDAF